MPESVEMPAPVSTTTRGPGAECAGPVQLGRLRPGSSPRRAGLGIGVGHGRHARTHTAARWRSYSAAVPAGATATVEVLEAADAEVRQRRAAGALLARGCTRGDRVAFALGSSADLICAVLGAARVGLIPVLLNATLTDAERDLLAEDADPVLRVFDAPPWPPCPRGRPSSSPPTR